MYESMDEVWMLAFVGSVLLLTSVLYLEGMPILEAVAVGAMVPILIVAMLIGIVVALSVCDECWGGCFMIAFLFWA